LARGTVTKSRGSLLASVVSGRAEEPILRPILSLPATIGDSRIWEPGQIPSGHSFNNAGQLTTS
jgi:hypothetical protein